MCFWILCLVDNDEENEVSQVEEGGEPAADNNDEDQEDTNGVDGTGDVRPEGQPKAKCK